MADLTAQELLQNQIASASQLGRFGGPELWFSSNPIIGAGVGKVQVVNPGPVNLTRPIEAFTIAVTFRLHITVAPYAAVAPEAPQNFLQNVTLQGQHQRGFGAQTPINMSGATIYALGQMTQFEDGSEYLINGVRGGNPGRPFTSAFTGAVGDHDITIFYQIPVSPQMGVGNALKRQSTNFLLQPADWGNTLQMTLQFGDQSSFGDATGATVAIQGPLGVGNPLVQVFANYALLGDYQTKLTRSGVVIRNEQFVPSLVAASNSTLLLSLAHQITNYVLIKTGDIQVTGLSGGVDTLATLSDIELEATQLQVDNKPIRNSISNGMMKSYLERMFNTVIPQGYQMLTFVDGQGILLAYRGDKLPGGSQLQVVTNVLTTGANQRQRVLQEYELGGPFQP